MGAVPNDSFGPDPANASALQPPIIWEIAASEGAGKPSERCESDIAKR
jgi:hypothetical protein